MIKQTDAHKRGKSSRDKGAQAERELAGILRDWYGYNVHRGKVFYGESDLVGLDGIHPEVKRVEKLNLYKAMEQAKDEAAKRKDGIPVVFHRTDRHEWLCTLRLPDFMDMYGAWRDDK